MTDRAKESCVQLEQLDDYLKAILKFKIREFVHLSPWFRNIPSIDTAYYARPVSRKRPAPPPAANDCPNRGSRREQPRRRSVRAAII